MRVSCDARSEGQDILADADRDRTEKSATGELKFIDYKKTQIHGSDARVSIINNLELSKIYEALVQNDKTVCIVGIFLPLDANQALVSVTEHSIYSLQIK